MRIRRINPQSEEEIVLVAKRMRETLIEVLGEERGGNMYSLEWLKHRVLFHLDEDRCKGAVFLAENQSKEIIGHCIVRVDKDEHDREVGLFSTTYVMKKSRRAGTASELLRCGEEWLKEKGITEIITYTDEMNKNLIELYKRHGYKITEQYAEEKMIKLSKK
jgi:GNAT superfamily N-acetyltransferase